MCVDHTDCASMFCGNSFLCEPLPVCSPEQTLCNDICVNLATDTQNCGACGTACAPSEACVAGLCN